MSSSSEDDNLEAFLASLRPKKKEKYRLSNGSLDDFVVDDDHVSFDEDDSESSGKEDSSYHARRKGRRRSDQGHKESSSDDERITSLSDHILGLELTGMEQNVSKGVAPNYDKSRQLPAQASPKQNMVKSNETSNTTHGERPCNSVSHRESITSSLKSRLPDLKKPGSLGRPFNLLPKHSTAMSSSKTSSATPKIIFSSDTDSDEEDHVFENARQDFDSRKHPPVGNNVNTDVEPQGCPSQQRRQKTPVKSSRILFLSDDEDEVLTSATPGKDLEKESIRSIATSSHNFLSLDDLSSTKSAEKEASPILRAPSSHKKPSRILVLSDDSSSESDPDDDVVFVEDDGDDDKENLERDILESPDDSPAEFYPTTNHSVDEVFKIPTTLPQRTPKSCSARWDPDSDEEVEEYTPLVARILGGNKKNSNNDPNLPPRRTSEPKVGKNFITPIQKPPKACATEKVKTQKEQNKKSNGLPNGLPLNCESGVGFKRNRNLLTTRLYSFFNETIFSSKLPKDMIVDWDKRLTKTAGVTKCSRQTVTSTKNGIRCVTKTYTARISLSEKVLDTLHRLRDTLCHEMCHAAVWLIDNQNDGHGPFWKAWARKASAAHPGMPVVKRCHSYDITYKYRYQCMTCRKIYGRHSKSIKVDKQACGVCHGQLVLLPQQNSSGTPAKSRQPNKFALFVKENYKITQKSRSFGGMTPKHSDVMKALSEQFASLSTRK